MSIKVNLKDISYRSISEDDKELISNFISYEKELEKFLVEDAIINQIAGVSRTYLFLNKNKLAGYITLLNDALRLDDNLITFFKNKNIHYKTLPAIKVGRLAVDDRYLRKGIGTIMLMLAYTVGKQICDKKCGCRFIILDAKKNKNFKKDPIHFYKKLNFKILKKRIKGTIPMYLDIRLENKFIK